MTPQPLPADVHVDRLLTDLSVAYVQDARSFVAARVFPIVPVNFQSDQYLIYPKGYFLRDEMAPRPLGGRAARTGYEMSSGTYLCTEKALSHPVDDRLYANADNPIAPDIAAQELLTGKAMINLDRSWSTAYFRTGVWATDLVGRASAPSGGEFLQWDQSASTPIKDIRQKASFIHSQTGRRPNKLVLGNTAFDVLCEHPDIVDRIKHVQRGVLTEDILAELFRVDEVIVAGGVQNSAAEGAADSIGFIVDATSALLVYAAPTPALNTATGGYTFAWVRLIPGLDRATGGVIARYRDDEAHSNVFEIRTSYDTRQVATDLGVFFSRAVRAAA